MIFTLHRLFQKIITLNFVKKKKMILILVWLLLFCGIGHGFEAIEKFSTLMNLPSSMSKNVYSYINKSVYQAYADCANESMKKAAKKVRLIIKPDSNAAELLESDIAIDGSWQKRGYDSLNGVVTGIARENQKVLDDQVFSKFYFGCSKWEDKFGSAEYIDWKAKHICQINHMTLSGSMESQGAINIFASLIEKYNLRYMHFIGDGDTNSFKRVLDSKPYGTKESWNKIEKASQ